MRKNYSNYSLDCATGENKLLVTDGAIVARTYNLPYSRNKTLLAALYRNLTIEKYNE
jgi:hypothetical protein